MIGRLQGTVLEVQCPQNIILLDVQGVGYELEVPLSTLEKCPASGQPLTLHTHLIVREDAHMLYGFYSVKERTVFRELLKVSGIGPKLALSILSGMEPEQLCACLQQSNVTALTHISGVGKKTAERMIIELRDRLGRLFPDLTPLTGVDTPVTTVKSRAMYEAQEALMALGYKSADALHTLKKLDSNTDDVPTLIRQALRQMVREHS